MSRTTYDLLPERPKRMIPNLIKRKKLIYCSFHLSELLAVLARLFISNFIVKYFLTDKESEIDRASTRHSSSLSSSPSSISSLTSSSNASIFLPEDKTDSIKVFSDALLSIYGTITYGDDRGKLACETLMKILWSITFYSDDEQIKRQLKSNGILIFLLHSLSETDPFEPFVLFCYSSQDEQSVKQLINPQTCTIYALLMDDDNDDINTS
ncbi:unnamed protein product [Didymodactylos carnosus]|uniref:Uncharacterized protein n=1 Tax=Didymodactylos carnosus TaxID=1234261 RepID=A0A814RR52_9BILA|nr:unnamed protein product [Didymodactylos carnosus]CAF3901489.1 unnamed protein product [Didymodactylos carnosus]